MIRRASEGEVKVEVTVGKKTVEARFAEVQISPVAARVAGRPAPNEKAVKITGMNKTTDVTLKRGVVRDQGFSDWLKDMRGGKSKHRTVVVTVPPKGPGKGGVRWMVQDAWIQKIEGPALKAEGNEVVIEEMVLSSEKVELA